jgi:UDP-3-O-[3-hydroxymyristoyl] glucosamine N-acyltransferase
VTSAGLTAQAVADLVGGRLLGDGGVVVSSVGPIDRAGPGALTMAVSPRYAHALAGSTASVVLVPPALAEAKAGAAARVVVPDPYGAMVRVIGRLFPADQSLPGIDPSARIGAGTKLGADVTIGPQSVIGCGVVLGDRCRLGIGVVLGDGVVVGEGTRMDARVVCYAGARIGRRVLVKAGAVIGGHGFGYLSRGGAHERIPHVGACIIGDDVEIGSNSCVDRGSLDDTVIGQGTKLDNLVHVGHNVRIGERCLLMAGVGVAGSTRLGNDVVLAGHVGVTDHLTIGDRVQVAAKSAVIGNVPADSVLSGNPARPNRQVLRAHAALYRLAPLVGELERLATEKRRDG